MDAPDDHTPKDHADDQESRPPTIKDLVDLCRELNVRGAKYIIIGGTAMLELGFVRATEDIDLLVDASLDNEKRIFDALATLPDQAVLELQAGDLEQYQVIRVADEITVDLMAKACGVDFAEAQTEIRIVELQGVKIPFATAELMLKLKQSVREKDVMDRNYLEHLLDKKKKDSGLY